MSDKKKLSSNREHCRRNCGWSFIMNVRKTYPVGGRRWRPFCDRHRSAHNISESSYYRVDADNWRWRTLSSRGWGTASNPKPLPMTSSSGIRIPREFVSVNLPDYSIGSSTVEEGAVSIFRRRLRIHGWLLWSIGNINIHVIIERYD